MSAAALVGRLQMRVSTTSSNGLIAASGDKLLGLHASHDFSITFISAVSYSPLFTSLSLHLIFLPSLDKDKKIR